MGRHVPPATCALDLIFWCSHRCLKAVKEDFCPVIALARGSVSWYSARALNHSKRRLNGRKLGNKVIMTPVNLKRSDTAELSHGQRPSACSYLLGSQVPTAECLDPSSVEMQCGSIPVSKMVPVSTAGGSDSCKVN